MRKHLVKSAEFWFGTAKAQEAIGEEHAILAMEQAYNHVESALSFILERVPGAQAAFDVVENKSRTAETAKKDNKHGWTTQIPVGFHGA